ncbi:MAG: DUF721 domain-containing protein [Magnetospirillum gryphiswaldense]|nr:DUF721 domain-containing protein [Magnetospirillum gryphiswaldense]
MSAEKQDQRRYGMVAVGVPVGTLTRPIFGRHGFAGGAMIVDWPAIVGAAVASYTLPIRVRFAKGERSGGTLEVKVANSAFATELQHLEPLILDRINGYFGWAAVARLKLRHGPLPRRDARVAAAAPSAPKTEARLTDALDKVDDPELKAVLERLGRHIAAKP